MISSDPGAGERVLDGDKVAIVVSLGKEVYDLPKLTGLTVDEAQDQILDTKMAFGKAIEQFSETVAEGHRHRLRPQGRHDAAARRHRRPDRLQGPPADPGRQLGRQGRRPRPAGPRASAASRSSALDRVQRRRAPRAWSSPRTPTAARSSRATPSTLRVSLGPELVEVPNVVASGVERRDRRPSRPSGSSSTSRRRPATSGLGFVFSMDPEAGTELPKGSTVTLYLI